VTYKFIFMLAFFSVISLAVAADKPKQLTGDDLKMATQMNDIYARHLYSSSCLDGQKYEYAPKTLTPAEKAQRVESYKKSCDCMTNIVLKTISPNDAIDYVSTTAGSMPLNAKRAKPDANRVKKFAEIAAINRDKQNRQQCGFKR